MQSGNEQNTSTLFIQITHSFFLLLISSSFFFSFVNQSKYMENSYANKQKKKLASGRQKE